MNSIRVAGDINPAYDTAYEMSHEALKKTIPHVFLPRKLPQKESIEYENELIAYMTDVVSSFGNTVPQSTQRMFKVWEQLQNTPFLHPLQISEAINSLDVNDMLALYIRKQNVGLVLSMPSDEKCDYVTLSTFAASLKNETITDSPNDVLVVYPEQSAKIPFSQILLAECFANQLSILNETELGTAMSKSVKSGKLTAEPWDLAEPLFVSKWLTCALSNETSNISSTEDFPRVSKKVRDDVLWHDTNRPFRRSGLWMTIKAVLQLNLTRELKETNGKFLYKLLMLEMMSRMSNSLIGKKYTKRELDLDLTIQMLAKVARRMEKLKTYSADKKNNLNSELVLMHKGIHEKSSKIIEAVRTKMDEQFAGIVQKDEQASQLAALKNLRIEDHCVQTLPKASKYFKFRKEESKIQKECKSDFPIPNYVPRFRNAVEECPYQSLLSATREIDLGFALCDIENWILTNLEAYMADETQDKLNYLRGLAFKYSTTAENYYKEDPCGGSRMILCLLKIVQILDNMSIQKYPLLKNYHSGINCVIIGELLLLKKFDLEIAYSLEKYFRVRNAQGIHPSLIHENEAKPSSFSVKFAEQSPEMQTTKAKILKEAEEKIEAKKKEIKEAREVVAVLRRECNSKTCDYKWHTNRWGDRNWVHSWGCGKCALQNRIDGMRVAIYERPLPDAFHWQNAVVFELLIPLEIACLRDVLHLFSTEFCKSTEQAKKIHKFGPWTAYHQINKYRNDFQLRTHLGSTTNTYLNSHYESSLHPDNSDDSFVVSNGYNCAFYANDGEQMFNSVAPESVKSFCTFAVKQNSPYQKLQWCLRGTRHNQNQILAKQSECPQDLKLSEFVEFGTLRAGHRLQLRNIFRAFYADTLTLRNDSVVYLLFQALWESGPIDDLNHFNWFRESHQDFTEADFTDEMIDLLSEILAIPESNWKYLKYLLIIVLFTVRILELQPNKNAEVVNKAVLLLLECRKVGLKWVKVIEEYISKCGETDTEKNMALRDNLIDAGICAALTYSVDPKQLCFPKVLGDITAAQNWLHTIVKIDNNITLNDAAISSMPVMRKNFLRMVRRTGIDIESTINHLLRNNSEALNKFALSLWAGAAKQNFGLWRQHDAPAQQIYFVDYKVDKEILIYIQVDVILGRFLVDGCRVSRLPDDVVHSEEFQRVFESTVFEVQPSGNNTHATISKFGMKPDCKSVCKSDCKHGRNYIFKLASNSEWIITEKRDTEDNDELELVPHKYFDNELPFILVDQYSHWWNSKKYIVEFRAKTFKSEDFFSDTIDYILHLDSMVLQETKTERKFVDVLSSSFLSIATFLKRFEDPKYIHVLFDERAEPPLLQTTIELPRTKLHFKLNQKFELMSHEFEGMRISNKQKIGVFIGLQQGILLESCNSIGNEENFKYIIPHGKISVFSYNGNNHQSTGISLEELREPSHFVYDVDANFRNLKAGKNYAAWFYLAYLHSVTSSPLPDPFTGITGTEQALKILQSGYAWSSEPFSEEATRILKEISYNSPGRKYYPPHLRIMQNVNWPNGLPSSAAHDAFRMLTKRLIEDSNRLGFLHFQNTGNQSANNGEPKNHFGKRAYFRNLVYTPNAILNSSFEPQMTDNEMSMTIYPRKNYFDKSCENMRRIASLGHHWVHELPQDFQTALNTLLISKNNLRVIQHEFSGQPTEYWIDEEFDLANHWLGLYKVACRPKSAEEKAEWTLFLTLMAMGGRELKHLLILHTIATNSTLFNGIRIPPYPAYKNPSEKVFDRSSITEIFKLHEIGLSKFLSDNGIESDSDSDSNSYSASNKRKQISRLKDEYKRDLAIQLELLTSTVERKWPCDNFTIYECPNASLIRCKVAVNGVAALLKKWFENRELGIFLDEVVNKLKLLGPISRQLELKEIIDDEKLSIENSSAKKFEINFEEKILSQFPSDETEVRSSEMQGMITNTTDIFKTGELIEDSKTQDEITNLKNRHQTFKEKRKELCSTLKEMTILREEKYLEYAGLYPRIVPTQFLPLILIPVDGRDYRTKCLINLIGSIGVVWTLEQQALRILKYSEAGSSMEVILQLEKSTIPHENWSPAEHPEWLILELELNMMIRRIQVEVARRMIHPPGENHSVMQLNMGEGKTVVIVPILAATLANENQLCRLTVLKPLFRTNLNSLRQIIGGMLNRRVYTFPCRRDMTIKEREAETILNVYKECQEKLGVAMTLPEYRLSFQLKMYEAARRNEIPTASSLLKCHTWLNDNARDILDESDEILHAKYQLIYTEGAQLPPEGGTLRWSVVQSLLKRVPLHMRILWNKYKDEKIEFNHNESKCPERFWPCRILDKDVYAELIDRLAEDFLSSNTNIRFNFPPEKRNAIKVFLTKTDISPEMHNEVINEFADNLPFRDTILLLAGYLKYGILLLAFSKRWRVNYGVNPIGTRKMAVPFKAKDVAAEMTEFGHPDVAICFTHLSYYYSGLSSSQLLECFQILDKLPNPHTEFETWISAIRPPERVDSKVRTYKQINLDDSAQWDELQTLLRQNTHVIDFWLSNAVFPKEAKQFPGKFMCTAWDLCSYEFKHVVSGFSGTNDSKELLPLPISQNDLKELEDTNMKMRKILVKQEYKSLAPNISGKNILQMLAQEGIPVLLDAGALMLELNNEQVAEEWLKISDKAAAVYFDDRNVLMVKDRQNCRTEYELSSLRDRLDRCVIYLDDAHTRGTDLKFPRGTKACVTLAGGITRDKTVQACMRMRMLVEGHHSVCFWASQEADNGIRELCGKERPSTEDVVNWICNNSRTFEKEGLVHWSAAGYNYMQKHSAHILNDNNSNSDALLALSQRCMEKELLELMKIYGEVKNEELLTIILNHRFTILKNEVNVLAENTPEKEMALSTIDRVMTNTLARVKEYIPDKKRFVQLLEEEQEKELEHELEDETEISRPGSATPAVPKLDDIIRQLIRKGSNLTGSDMDTLVARGNVLLLPYALCNTEMWPDVQESCWAKDIFVTKDFLRTIENPCKENKEDEFLRPVSWIVGLPSQDKDRKFLLLLSPFETNEFLPEFRKSKATSVLHMFAPPHFPGKDCLLSIHKLMIPPFSKYVPGTLQAKIYVFSGALYFKDEKEFEEYCNFLALLPGPRSPEHENAFLNGKISTSGFAFPEYWNEIYPESDQNASRFIKNPVKLVKGIIERRYGFLPPTSHVSRVIVESKKPSEFLKDSPKEDVIHMDTK